jgi:xanthine dehydrogenase accessory factor
MDILTEIVRALKAPDHVVLSTIVSSSGSAPLPTGSSLLVCGRGARVLGTVGGGLLEASVTKEAKEFFAQTRESVLRTFELNESGTEEGMICGGTVEVLIEQIGEEALGIFSRLAEMRGEGDDCTLLRRIDPSGRVTRHALDVRTDQVAILQSLDGLLKELGIETGKFLQSLQKSHREEGVAHITAKEGELIIQPIVGIQPLIIFGGGHVGRCLSKIAAATGFTVTVVDDREEYASPGRFPEATRTISRPWSNAFLEIAVTPSTSIVIVTHGHESDKEVLRSAIGTPARFIGMIGSGKKVAATYDVLRKEGVPVESLKRVHAPIGLDIGAVTAEEIAVSIVAELIRDRRRYQGVSSPLSDRMNRWFDLTEYPSSVQR